MSSNQTSRCLSRCTPTKHIFAPFAEDPSTLGGTFQRCECERVAIDRTLGGGRSVMVAEKGERRVY